MLLALERIPDSRLPFSGFTPTNPRTGEERFDIEKDAFSRAEQFFSEERLLYEAYEDANEKLFRSTGKRLPNPMLFPEQSVDPEAGMFVVGAGQPTRTEALTQFRKALQEARDQGNIEVPDPATLETEAYRRAKEAHDLAFNAGLVSNPWTGPMAFLGVMAGALSDPVNLAALPFGASARLSGTVAMRILQAMGQEGAIAAGTQALIELKTAPLRKKADIEQQSLVNILAAGIGGGVLGGAVRGIGEAMRARVASGLGLTLDELDSAVVAQRYALDVESAPKGVSVEAHLDALNAAYAAVAKMEPIVPGGAFSLVRRPFVDALDIMEGDLRARDLDLAARERLIIPQFTEGKLDEFAGVIARLDVIESELANPNLTLPERRALLRRRDELLADTPVPETMRSALEQRRELSIIARERSNIAAELDRIDTARALDPGFTPGPVARRAAIRKIAAEKIAAADTLDTPEVHSVDLIEAQRIAALRDPTVVYEDRSVKASDLLEQITEEQRVAKEIADACMGLK